MKDLQEYKSIMKISKEKLADKESSLGDLSMSYGETYVDFMLSSTSSDILLRIDEDKGNEILSIVCEDDATQTKKDILFELIKDKTIFNQLINVDISFKKTDTETIIDLMSLEGKEINEIGEIISNIFVLIWPYILEEKTIEKKQKEDSENHENNSPDDIANESEIEEILIDKDTESVDNSELNQGKVYIKDNLPKRNGRTRLIRRIISDSSYQLYFQLPDKLEHTVEITCYDSQETIDNLSAMVRNQFRYYIFPNSTEPSVFVNILVDGIVAYSNEFRIPYYLRLKKKENDFLGNDNKVPILDHIISEINEIEDDNNIDLNIDVDSSILSKDAVKFIKGEWLLCLTI